MIKKIKRYRYILLLLLISAVTAVRDLACSITMAVVTNAVIYGGDVIGSILWVTIAVIFRVPLKGLETYLKKSYKIHGQYKLSKEIAKRIASLHIKYVDNKGTVNILAGYTSDLDKLLSWFTDVFPAIIRIIVYIIGAFVYGLTQSVQLTLGAMPVIIVVTPLITKISKSVQRISDAEHQATSNILAQMQEVILNEDLLDKVLLDPELIKECSLEDKKNSMKDSLMQRLEKFLQQYQDTEQKSAIYAALVPIFGLAASFLPGLLTAVFGAGFLFYGEITVGFLIAFAWMAMSRLGYVLPQIGDFMQKTREAASAATRISELFHWECERQDGKITIPENSNCVVEFKNVNFNYRGREQILKDISFHADKGETIALVGSSGSGKSTVIKLLLGFYEPYDGIISVMGRPLRDWNLEVLRSLFAPVFQDVFISPGSINENIAGIGGTPGEITKAIQDAGLDTFISSLPDGGLTILNEHSIDLSEEQKQRIAIARAFYKQSQIIILDEPASAPDTVTESELQDTLKKLCENKTTIVIAHRLQMVQNADRIYVLENGSIVEYGTHEELMNNKGTYWKLHIQQSVEKNVELNSERLKNTELNSVNLNNVELNYEGFKNVASDRAELNDMELNKVELNKDKPNVGKLNPEECVNANIKNSSQITEKCVGDGMVKFNFFKSTGLDRIGFMLKYLRKSMPMYVIGIVLVCGYGLLGNIFTGQIYKVIIQVVHMKSITAIWFNLLVTFLFLITLVIITSFVGSIIYYGAVAKAGKNFLSSMSEKILCLSFSEWNKRYGNDWLSILNRDADAAMESFKAPFINLMKMVFQTVGGIIILFVFKPPMAIYSVLAGFFYMWIDTVSKNKSGEYPSRERTLIGKASAAMSDILAGFSIIKLYETRYFILRRHDNAVEQCYNFGKKVSKVYGLADILAQIGYTVAYAGTLIFGLILVNSNSIELSEMMALWPISAGVSYGIMQFSYNVTGLQPIVAAVDRIKSVFGLPEEECPIEPAQ